MAAKAPVWTTAFGTLGYAYIAKPDDKAPEGASFKPDGKFKGTLIFDSEDAIEQLRKDCIAMIRAAHPEAPEDDDQLALPMKPGEAYGGKKGEALAGKFALEAKSQFRPGVFDALGAKCPDGVFAYSGDTVRFKVSPYVFKKTEKVKEGKKLVDVDLFGLSFRLVSVQIKTKGAGGGGGGFDAVEDGDFDGSTAERREERTERSQPKGKPADADGDY